MIKNGLYRHVHDFAVDYDSVDISRIKDIYKYLMKSYNIVYMIRFYK